MPEGATMCGLNILVYSFHIPFTKLTVDVVREVIADASEDEVRKELKLLGLIGWGNKK